MLQSPLARRYYSVLFDLSSYFPVQQSVEVVKYEHLVVVDHRIGLSDTKVHARFVDQLLALLRFLAVLILRSTREQEVLLQAFNRFLYDFLLIVQQTKL